MPGKDQQDTNDIKGKIGKWVRETLIGGDEGKLIRKRRRNVFCKLPRKRSNLNRR